MTSTLSKKYVDNARESATKRLEGWINRVKDDKPQITGIPRLQSEFSGVFKKIQWKPRHIRNIERKWKENYKHCLSLNEDKAKAEKNKFAGLPSRSSVPRSLQDLTAQDSNSSNVSSRLEYREDFGKLSAGTPIVFTPFSLAGDKSEEGEDLKNNVETGADDVEESAEQATSIETANVFRSSHTSGRRGAIMKYDQSFLQRFKRRRRRPNKKVESQITVTQSESPTQVVGLNTEDNALNLPQTTRKGSSMHAIETGDRPKSSHTSIRVNFSGKKGAPVEFMFRRSLRLAKAFTKPAKASCHQIEVALPVTKEHVSEERRTHLIGNFRRIVRLLIHVRVLLNVSRLRIEEEEKSKEFKRIDGGCELSFDPGMYKTALSYSGLTTRIKKALKKSPEERDGEDARMLMDVMLRMPVFMKYSKKVKQWLAKQMWYDCFHNGRVIIRQGDPGSRMYFLVSGEVDLKRTDVSITGGAGNSYHLKTLSAGATFGEIALIRDMKREFTAVCKGTSEFLSLSKSEFNNALRHRWERDCNTRFSFLRSNDLFASWTDKQVQHCADASELKEYIDNKVILGDIDRLTESVYFIRKGRCDVVRRIAVFRHQSPYLRPELYLTGTEKRRKEIAEKSYCRSKRIYKKEVHFLTVTTLHPGNFFGAGESLRDTFILSRGKTECVLVSSAQFSIQGKSEQLRTMARDRDLFLPSNKDLYKRFQVNRKWYEYRSAVLKEICGKRKIGQTSSYADVPRTIKNEPRIPNDLINYN